MASKETIIKNCKKYLGQPYVWGAESLEEGGYDCSGYAYNVFRDSGYNVNRLTADGYRRTIGVKIDKSQKDVSDVLFFGKNNKATHIAFYAGNGKMYESCGGSKNTKKNPGKGVVLSNIAKRSDLMEVRRIVDSNTTPVAETTPRSWLQKGDEGQKVKDMQIMLIAVGFSCGKYGADGDFGDDSRKALIAFQNAYGLKADGLYGDKSKAKLEEVYKIKITPVVANPTSNFVVGKVYTLQTELKVRTGAGTNYSAKKYSQLTADGKRHDADGDGALDKGTRVTCREVKIVSGNTWIKTPSGWLAAIYNGKVYIK